AGLAVVAIVWALRHVIRGMRRVHADERGRPHDWGWRDALLAAVWIGIVAGLAEAVNGIVRHRIRHMPTGEVVSGELFWLAPLAAVTMFVLLSLVLVAADRLFGRRLALPRFVPALFVALATYGFV